MKKANVFFVFHLYCSLAAFNNSSAAADFFDTGHGGVSSGQSNSQNNLESNDLHDPYYASKPRKCHIICGPNSEAYELHFRCLSGQGVILKEGLTKKSFNICRINKNDDILCDAAAESTQFTILGTAHTSAVAIYKGKDLGHFDCHNE
jgi:hypothetical protein